jgi:predicted Zn-dependent peptidase
LIQAARLDSGSPVLLESVEHTDVFSIGLWQVHGSRDESQLESGFTHFLEHMLFKGTGRRSAFQIAQEIERVGGYLNAFTEKEVTCFYCTLPAESAALAIDVLADMYFCSVLDSGEIEKEKSVVINEIQTIEDNPEEKGHQMYLEGLWNGHALSRKITGECAEVQSIAREPLERFYHLRFVPASTVVSAAGSLDAGRILDQLNRTFSSFGGAPAGGQRVPPSRKSSWRLKADKFEQAHVYTGIGFKASREPREYFKDLVFNTLFGESMSSRLFQHLRESKGLCYSVYSFRSYFTDAALWTIYANTTPQSLPALLEGLNEELARLHRDPPSEKEVAEARSQIRGGMILAKEDMENRMKRLFRQHHLTDRVVEHEESLALLASIGREDVIQFIEQHILPDRFNLLAYGSKGIDKLAPKAFSF